MSHTTSPNSDSRGGNSSPTGKRETITARAKRIFGRNLKTTEEASTTSEISILVKNDLSRKPSNARREQVLRAQRTHRQRTQGYINELEKEVLRLRDRETELSTENQRLNARIEMLEQNLQAVNIQLPTITQPTEAISLADHEILTPASLPRTNGFSTDHISVDFTDLAHITAIKGCSSHAAEGSPIPYEAPSYQLEPNQSDQQAISSDQFQTPATYKTMSSQEAVDFVLELERPCLPHIKHYMQNLDPPAPPTSFPPPDYNLGPSHAFTISANIVSTHLSQHPEAQPLEIPQADIERLFQTSLALVLGPDVTPVQIWANVSRISRTRYVDAAMMARMTGEFKKYIRCNSFGAVIERSTVDSIIGYYFPGERFHDVWNDGLPPPEW